MRMEIWYAEVKPNETLHVAVGDLKLLHFSGAALGEVTKTKRVKNSLKHVKTKRHVKNVVLKLINDGKQLPLGTLSSKVAPQIKLNLVFERDFELSHGWKDGSVYFSGFVADISRSDERNNPSDENEDDKEERDGPFPLSGRAILDNFRAPGEPREVKAPKEQKVPIPRKRKEE